MPTHTEIAGKSLRDENTESPPKIKLFYSWQSEVFPRANKNLIRSAIEAAGKKIEEKCRLEIDEATRNKAGSPNIPLSIFEKIDNADVFICDLSRVAGKAPAKKRKSRAYFNANVSIELGYAIRSLGWDRIILVCNRALGDPEDAPFDVRSHRFSTYSCKENRLRSKAGQKEKTAARLQLADAIASSVSQVAKDNPLKPSQLLKLTPAQLRRGHDLKQLVRLFEKFSYSIYDKFFFCLGYPYITCEGLEMHSEFKSRYESAETVFNDPHLKKAIGQFAKEWNECFRYHMHMDMHFTNKYYHFHMPLDLFVDDEQERQHSFTQDQREPLENAFVNLITFLQKHYPEFSSGLATVVK